MSQAPEMSIRNSAVQAIKIGGKTIEVGKPTWNVDPDPGVLEGRRH